MHGKFLLGDSNTKGESMDNFFKAINVLGMVICVGFIWTNTTSLEPRSVSDERITFSNQESTFLYFGADWCIPCRQMKELFKELQKAGMATPELQEQVDEVFALINRQPSTDEFSYKAMKLKVDDFLKDLSGVAIVPGLPVGDHPVMESMEKAYEAFEKIREEKVKVPKKAKAVEKPVPIQQEPKRAKVESKAISKDRLPLTELPGLGPTTEKKFVELGVNSVEELLLEDPSELAKLIKGCSEERIKTWIEEGKELVKK